MTATTELGPAYGLKKFVAEYNSSFKSMQQLQLESQSIIGDHKEELAEQKLSSKRQKRTADKDGWVTVTKSDRHAFRAHKVLRGAIVSKSKEKPIRRPPVKLV